MKKEISIYSKEEFEKEIESGTTGCIISVFDTKDLVITTDNGNTIKLHNCSAKVYSDTVVEAYGES